MSILFSGRSLCRLRTNLVYLNSKNMFHKSLIIPKSDETGFSTNLSETYEQKSRNPFLPVTTTQSYFQKIKQMVGFQGDLKYPQPVMSYAAYRLYMSIQYQIDYEKFFKLCNSPDVMYSFCLITFLHIWMLSVPLMQFGQSGLYVRKALYKNMWKDIETRDRKLKSPMNKKNKLITYTHLNDIFRGHLVGFDEGLLSDDTVLAGAIWRHLLEQNEIKDYAVLGKLCDYIRKNIQHLDNINEIDYLKHGIITFVDLDQKEVDHLKEREKLIEIIRAKEQEE